MNEKNHKRRNSRSNLRNKFLYFEVHLEIYLLEKGNHKKSRKGVNPYNPPSPPAIESCVAKLEVGLLLQIRPRGGGGVFVCEV